MNAAILNVIIRVWMLETCSIDELELKSNIDFYLEINARATEKSMPISRDKFYVASRDNEIWLFHFPHHQK